MTFNKWPQVFSLESASAWVEDKKLKMKNAYVELKKK